MKPMASHPIARHLVRAKDLADARYAEPLTVADLARTAGLSQAHFSREFRRAFGESPHVYLLTRRLERAAVDAADDRPHGGRHLHGRRPVQPRVVHDDVHPGVRQVADGVPRQLPARLVARVLPSCVLRFYGRPQNRTFREDGEPA